MTKLNEQPYFDLDNNYNNFENHYNWHVLGVGDHADNDMYLLSGLTKEEYNNLANELSEAPAGPISSDDNVVGYIAKNGKRVKYRQSDQLMVVYIKDRPGQKDQAISLYKVKPYRFVNKIINSNTYGYDRELPENEKLAEVFEKINNYETLTEEDLVGVDLNKVNEELTTVGNLVYNIYDTEIEAIAESKKLVENLMKKD